ncbi:MAG: hypothetical protein IKK43_05375 [Clostridia bacterium]|nr:hypothetical protein [Clostridia bacterium]
MLKKINKNEIFQSLIFVIGFMVFLFYNLATNNLSYDRMWTFHMTQKIAMGEIPYSEINIIITPLFYQLGALLFKLLGRMNFVVYAIYDGFVGGFLSLLGYKIIREITNKDSISFFASLFFVSIISSFIETNYNTLLMVWILTAMLLEIKKEKNAKKKKYNILLGFFLGLCAATKHTVGGIVLIASLCITILKKIIFKEKILNELSCKLLGIGLVGVPYLIWLITTGALHDFVNLAILGMFDFAEKNTSGNFFNSTFFVNIIVIYSTILLFNYYKEDGEKNIQWLIMGIYAIATMSYAIPILNFYHIAITVIIPTLILMCFAIKFLKSSTKISMLLIMCVYMIVKVLFLILFSGVQQTGEDLVNRWETLQICANAMISVLIMAGVLFVLFDKQVPAVISVLCILLLPVCANLYIWKTNIEENGKYYIPEYSCIGLRNEEIQDILEINKFILDKEKEGYNVYILDIIASKYMIPLHRNNYKFDLILNGNLGYNGQENLIKEISSIENILILRQKPELETINLQQPEEIDKYIEENYKKIGEINNLEIYN